ncbi:MAG TPA: CcmD family protein [Chryseosolibacter sp.]
MKTPIKYLLSFVFLMLSNLVFAQDVEMADTFRSEGKIYVVVAIVLIVLTGLIVFLYFIDRKVTRLEKMIEGKSQTKEKSKSF